MADVDRLRAAHQLRLEADLYARWKRSNPGEASKYEAFVTAILAGQNPAPPTLATATGRWLTGMAGMALPEASTPPPLPPTPPATSGPMFGFSDHVPTGSQTEADEHFARLKAVGSKVVREDFAWSWMNGTKGSYDFGHVDVICRAARKHGLKVLAQIGYAPAWANGGRLDSQPDGSWGDKWGPLNPADFGVWAGKLAAHLKANHADVMLAVTPWNEPNIPFLFNPHTGKAGDPAYYVQLHNAAYDAIKTVYPALEVWGGDTAGAGAVQWDEQTMAWSEHVIPRIKFDAWACHPYYFGQGGPDRDDGQSADEMTATNWPSGLARLFWGDSYQQETLAEQLARHGHPNVKIHATEVGVPTDRPDGSPASRGTHESAQAAWFTKFWTLWTGQPRAGHVFFYTSHDNDSWDTTDHENHFGAWRSDGNPKPVVQAIKTALGV